MATLKMNGPYDLNEENIDEVVTKTSPGNYALGFIKKEKDESLTFIVKYVGRSDGNLNKRLKNHIGKYDKFKYSYAQDSEEAFHKECKNYHDFGESESLDNENHPDSPDDLNLRCPVCG